MGSSIRRRYAAIAAPESASIASSPSAVGTSASSRSDLRVCSATLAASSSIWYCAVPRLAYLKDTTSPCSVIRIRPPMDPAGWAAIARPVGAPPRLTEPPRPWKKAMGTPASRPTRVSLICALYSSQLDARKPPSLLESE